MARKKLWMKKFLLACRPVFQKLFLSNPEKIEKYHQQTRKISRSGMVTQFNIFHKIFYKPFFRKVKTLSSDIQNIRNLAQKGPLVFVIKNRGHLEYRFFNDLFLKEKLKISRFSNQFSTLLWWPFKKFWQYFLSRLDTLYKHKNPLEIPHETPVSHLEQHHSLFINLSVSRDDLFGITGKNPLTPLAPILDYQKESSQNITIIPLQFLYDKAPEKSEKSFFEFLFGEKSNPGGFRKFLIMLFSFRRSPQVKFGTSISLKDFIETHSDSQNILDDLYSEIEEVLRIERVKVTGPKLKPKSQMVKDILADSLFEKNLIELSEASGESLSSLKKEAEKILNEIGADVNYNFVQFCYIALSYLWNNVYNGIVIKHDQLNKVRNVAGKTPIVLVPMHRSHIDYMLISYIFYENNITYPHICAGINMNFWPFGNFARKGGAFFIRRSIKGNKVYKETLQAYLKSLLSQNYCLEFFIEGTRSRTGKMLKPKMGILSMLLKAHDLGACEDIHFVPIAINYDQIFEEKAYETEKKGGQKKKESAGGLLKTRKFLGKKYGKVYIDFGEPISLNNYIQNIAKAKENLETLPEITESFAFALTREMNKIALVTPMSLVCLAIMSLNKNSFTFEELFTQILKFKDYLDYKDVVYSDLIQYNDRWAYNQAFQTLVSRNFIKEVETYDGHFFHVEKNKRTQIDYYKNNILHFFISLSCFSKIITDYKKSNFTFEELVKDYKNLKQILTEEFTFSSSSYLEDHVNKVITYAIDQSWIKKVSDSSFEIMQTQKTHDDLNLFGRLLHNYLETHLLTLKYLRKNDFNHQEKKSLAKDILEKSKPLLMKEEFKHPEALGQFTIENSLTTWAKLGLIQEDTVKKKQHFTSSPNKDPIEKWIHKIENFLNVTMTHSLQSNHLIEDNSSEQISTLH